MKTDEAKKPNSLNEALKFKFGGTRPPKGVVIAGSPLDESADGHPEDIAMGLREPGGGEAPLALDDTERVKVLSPGRLVVKRFFRNRLAMLGFAVLIIMFSFTFAGPVIYPYSQTQLFYKYDYLNTDYASATERTEYVPYVIPGGPEIRTTIMNRFNSYIIEIEAEGADEKTFAGTDGAEYIVTRLGERVYTLSTAQTRPVGVYRPAGQVATYNRIREAFSWTGEELSGELMEAAVASINEGAEEFEFLGTRYLIGGARTRVTVSRAEGEFAGLPPDGGLFEDGGVFTDGGLFPYDLFVSELEENIDGEDFEFAGRTFSVTAARSGAYEVNEVGEVRAALIASTFVFNAYDTEMTFSDEFRVYALLAIYGDKAFTADGASYSVRIAHDDIFIADASGADVAELSAYSIRRYSGQDTLSIGFKETAQDAIEEMLADNAVQTTFVYGVHSIDENGNFEYDENGAPIFVDSLITVNRKGTGEFVLTCEQNTYLIDIFASPTLSHPVGTDGDGMDVLARMMYGGRVSLMVGFVVVILEIVLGVIMGGISGFFGGWVDTLFMRIADVFYCVPGYPILIIMGAIFDKLRMDPYQRLIWMMVILGLLGWAVVARLVRGQILSLREQEFMIAQEATGMRARKRIFRHLVPNVMPQLIVRATMGLGEVIIYESTLSFLGLGVKHPLATWGSMINSVTGSSESMIKYAYIWVPVGLLICLTVIAFNFVGDGLRDAFDPKMRR